jgi:hypothetical protein
MTLHPTPGATGERCAEAAVYGLSVLGADAAISSQDRSGRTKGAKTMPIASDDETARSVAYSAFTVGSIDCGAGGREGGEDDR